MTVRIATAAFALAAATAASVAAAPAALATDAPHMLARIAPYADIVESIFADGFESGDVAAVRRATVGLTAQIDGLTALGGPDTTERSLCNNEVIEGLAAVRAGIPMLRDGALAPQAFLQRVGTLRASAETCIRVWGDPHVDG